ncbi:putative hscarg dehydrogenase [Coleophoma crateriformis]|uniref:Putative hscarg dehydrogenase n=1 Tax=Coleophoma crateriformis TaxID=565419 RepID=A0A3D8SGG4_9HELO|nr:putative hscarg dehydrogenase [Coleophoma crateriformis]
MTSEKPLLVVLGATGNQGGSVLAHFLSLSPSPYALRGVTRDPSSPKSISLASLGVEVVAGDFDDPSSLDAAFKDASAIFSVTDFWQPFTDASLRERASTSGQNIGVASREKEAQQNKNIIDAAAKVGTLERFVFSSLPNANKLSGGKYSHVYHFDGKAMAEEYGRSTYPELWEKTTVLYAGFYLENYFGPTGSLFPLQLNKERDTIILECAEPLATAPFPWYSVVTDTGPLVQAMLRAAPGQKLLGVNEWLSFRDFARSLAQVLGKGFEVVDRNPSFDMGDPDLEKDFADMLGFCIEFGYDGGKVDKTIVQPGDLGVPVRLGSVREWLEKQDWDKVLQIK